MLSPSIEIIQLVGAFGPFFTKPTFQKVQMLLYGAILAPGKRTVTAVLSILGLEQTGNFGKYHRVLNRSPWSTWLLSKTLLALLVFYFVPSDQPLRILCDLTLERRAGKKIRYKGWFHDAVRSTAGKVVTSLGLRWLCLSLLVQVPWCERPWALPFMVILVPSEKTCKRLKKRHRKPVWWTAFALEKLRAWYPERGIIAVGDSGFAAIELIHTCRQLNVTLVTRLRTDAQLYDFPGPQPSNKRGPKPKKGAQLPTLDARLSDPKTQWQPTTLAWYGGIKKDIEYTTGTCLWYKAGNDPAPLRWVLTRYEETSARTGKVKIKAAGFLCSDTTDPTLSADTILSWFVGRWNIEVTFEEMRAHMGLETQRNWSVRAIERTTPCLFGVFSLVVLMAKQLYPTQLPVRSRLWYSKDEATFSDVLGAVRTHLWRAMNYTQSPQQTELCLIPKAIWQRLQQAACYAA
jgi:hypothetical protein